MRNRVASQFVITVDKGTSAFGPNDKKENLRVLHLIETLGSGGAERLLVTMLPGLARKGIEPIVGVLREPLCLERDLLVRGIRVVQIPKFRKWNLYAARNALSEVCRREGIAIIHAHLYFASIYAAVHRLTGGPPMAETFHNLAYAGANANGWKLAMRRHLRAGLLRRAEARTYGVSAAVAKHYEQALSLAPGQVKPLPNSIDLECIDTITTIPRPDSSLRIVVPGRLVREKGHADLLEALKECDIPNLELRFVGGGPLAPDLSRLARDAGIELTITGRLAHSEFLAEVAVADIVVAPSHYEGFGIAVAEAMALGRAVLASEAGGLPEVVGKAGILFPIGDIDALRGEVQKLAQSPALRTLLGEKARMRSRREFGSARAAAQLAADYRSLLSGQH